MLSPQPTAETTVLSDLCVHCALYSSTGADRDGRGAGLAEGAENTRPFPAPNVGTGQAPKDGIRFHKRSPTPTKRKAQPFCLFGADRDEEAASSHFGVASGPRQAFGVVWPVPSERGELLTHPNHKATLGLFSRSCKNVEANILLEQFCSSKPVATLRGSGNRPLKPGMRLAVLATNGTALRTRVACGARGAGAAWGNPMQLQTKTSPQLAPVPSFCRRR